MVLQEPQNSGSGGRGGGGGGGGSGSGGGGGGGGSNRYCKKQKQDRIPQRGLGVAELERILRDQQNGAATATATASPSGNSPSGLIVPPPHLRQPLPLPDFNSMLKTPIPIASPATNPNLLAPPLPPPAPAPAVHGTLLSAAASASAMWNTFELGPYDAEKMAVGSNHALPYPMPSDPLANPMHWYHCSAQKRSYHHPQQQQHQPPFPNASMTILPSSSGANLQIEPPSNQINNSSSSSNYRLPPWPEEQRICGIKRPWSFPFDSMPSSGPIPCRIPTFTRPDELLPIHGHDDAYRYDPRNPIFRDGTSGSGASQADCKSSYNHHNGTPNEDDFLTLGPSVSSAPPLSSSKSMQLVGTPLAKQRGFPEFCSSMPSHGSMEETTSHPGIPHEKPFYEFFPTEPSQRDTDSEKQGGEAEENIDLNLKL